MLNNQDELNLINLISKSSFEYKEELILYAIKYQNDFIACANSENNIAIISNNNLLNPSFKVCKDYDRLNFYYLQDDKNYYITSKKSDDTSSFSLINMNNKTYYAYAIDSNKLKSLQYTCYGYNEQDKKDLSKYENITIDYNDYDLTNYKNNYFYMEDDLLETIILKDNNTPTYSILDAPDVLYDIESESLYVDLNYQELLNKDEDYYLCICNKNDVFQHSPIIKIKFKYDTSNLFLSKYKTLIKKDTYYLLYIEDKDNNIISNSTILSTFIDTVELDNYNMDILKSMIKSMKSFLLQKYSCKDFIESVCLTILSYNVSTKNFFNIFKQEILNSGIDSSQCNNLDSIFLDIILKEYIEINNKITTNVYYKENDYICFNDKNLNVVVLDFYTGYEHPQKTVYDSNTYIDLKNRGSYYTLIYGINKLKYRTGFFLINNITKKIYYYKINFEEVK